MVDSAVKQSVTARRLPLRARPDLVIRPVRYGRRLWWAIKDPVSLRYFQMRDEECRILRWLDGRISLEGIRERFERDFAPRKLHPEYLQSFLRSLHAEGLILADTAGQGEELLARRGRLSRRAALAWTNPLAIRFGGIDPEPLLRGLYGRLRWLFSPVMFVGCLLLVSCALLVAGLHVTEFAARVPSLQAFFTPANLLWMMAAIATVKIVHELAHGLTCRHFGGECHELGLMLLVFTPCLYCNVSDAWMLPSKWQRIAVSAAGIVVECVLAAVCFFLWWFSQPGLFHAMCFNMMVVCSVGTILFNANPLMRYDGYFILADLIEVPNLGERSMTLVRRGLMQWFFAFDPEIERALPERRRVLLAGYAVAALTYRIFVVTAILWFCYEVLQPHGLQVLAALLTGTVLFGFVAVPLFKTIQFLRNPSWSRHMNGRRFAARGGAVALLAALALWVPLPYRIAAPVALAPADARRVYVTVPGTLRDTLRAGAKVEEGAPLARLENLKVRQQVVRLEADRDRQQLHVTNLRRRVADRAAESQIPAAREALADLEERLRQVQLDESRLTLTAPRAGTVLPPPSKPKSIATGQLASWSGSPLEEDNVGSYLETGTTLCMIGDPRRLDALLVIDQSDLVFVRSGQSVDVRLDQYPGRRLHGEIYEIAEIDLDVVPRRLAIAGDLPVERGPDGVERPASTSYLARVRLQIPEPVDLIDATGSARIHVTAQPLARRLYRWLSRTFGSFANSTRQGHISR